MSVKHARLFTSTVDAFRNGRGSPFLQVVDAAWPGQKEELHVVNVCGYL